METLQRLWRKNTEPLLNWLWTFHGCDIVYRRVHPTNHPDNWLTIERRSSIWLSEHYDGKPDDLTVFFEILVFTENQCYEQLLLISIELIPPTGFLTIIRIGFMLQ